MFGSIPQIFLEPFQDALRYFNSRLQVNHHNSSFPAILHMTIRYKIHWISIWSYTISNNLLNREFSVKWWDSLKIDPVINQINKDFPHPVHKVITLKTRSQSSLENVLVAEKSSRELKDLADQLLLQASQLEEEEKASPASSESSTSHKPFDPFQDSQDPYEGHNLDSPQTILVAPVTTQNNSRQLQIRSLFKTSTSRQVTVHELCQPTQEDKNSTSRCTSKQVTIQNKYQQTSYNSKQYQPMQKDKQYQPTQKDKT